MRTSQHSRESLGSLHPWRFSRCYWMRLWAAWCDPALQAGVGRDLPGSLQPAFPCDSAIQLSHPLPSCVSGCWTPAQLLALLRTTVLCGSSLLTQLSVQPRATGPLSGTLQGPCLGTLDCSTLSSSKFHNSSSEPVRSSPVPVGLGRCLASGKRAPALSLTGRGLQDWSSSAVGVPARGQEPWAKPKAYGTLTPCMCHHSPLSPPLSVTLSRVTAYRGPAGNSDGGDSRRSPQQHLHLPDTQARSSVPDPADSRGFISDTLQSLHAPLSHTSLCSTSGPFTSPAGCCSPAALPRLHRPPALSPGPALAPPELLPGVFSEFQHFQGPSLISSVGSPKGKASSRWQRPRIPRAHVPKGRRHSLGVGERSVDQPLSQGPQGSAWKKLRLRRKAAAVSRMLSPSPAGAPVPVHT